jgi:hypothetical protein
LRPRARRDDLVSRLNALVGRPDAVECDFYLPEEVNVLVEDIGALFHAAALPYERAIPQLSGLNDSFVQLTSSYPRIRIRWIDATGLSENSVVLSVDVMSNSAALLLKKPKSAAAFLEKAKGEATGVLPYGRRSYFVIRGEITLADRNSILVALGEFTKRTPSKENLDALQARFQTLPAGQKEQLTKFTVVNAEIELIDPEEADALDVMAGQIRMQEVMDYEAFIRARLRELDQVKPWSGLQGEICIFPVKNEKVDLTQFLIRDEIREGYDFSEVAGFLSLLKGAHQVEAERLIGEPIRRVACQTILRYVSRYPAEGTPLVAFLWSVGGKSKVYVCVDLGPVFDSAWQGRYLWLPMFSNLVKLEAPAFAGEIKPPPVVDTLEGLHAASMKLLESVVFLASGRAVEGLSLPDLMADTCDLAQQANRKRSDALLEAVDARDMELSDRGFIRRNLLTGIAAGLSAGSLVTKELEALSRTHRELLKERDRTEEEFEKRDEEIERLRQEISILKLQIKQLTEPWDHPDLDLC